MTHNCAQTLHHQEMVVSHRSCVYNTCMHISCIHNIAERKEHRFDAATVFFRLEILCICETIYCRTTAARAPDGSADLHVNSCVQNERLYNHIFSTT